MANNGFYQYDGSIREIPNSLDVRDYVFENIDSLNRSKSFCAVNSKFTEIFFFYPHGDSEITRYVKFNWVERTWDEGQLVRTAWHDVDIFFNPIAAGTDGFVYTHESGVDDYLSAMNESIDSSPFQIAQGDYLMEIIGLYPDIKSLTGTLALTLYTREYPHDDEISEALSVTSTTEKLSPHISGRQARIRYATTDLSTDWRAGVLSLDVQALGDR